MTTYTDINQQANYFANVFIRWGLETGRLYLDGYSIHGNVEDEWRNVAGGIPAALWDLDPYREMISYGTQLPDGIVGAKVIGLAAAEAGMPGVFSVGAGSECGPNSFDGHTMVLMADETLMAIKDVDVGDVVLVTDPETGERGARRVERLIRGVGDKDLVDLTIRTDHGSGVVEATDGHPFWVEGSGEWVDAGDLEPGDILLTADGDHPVVEAVNSPSAYKVVYNLTVDDIHTYHVIVAGEAVVVHNHSCGRFGIGGVKPPKAPSYRSTDGGMSRTRDIALAKAEAFLEQNSTGYLRLECAAGCHVHVDVYNNRGLLLETRHFPYQAG